MQSTHNDHEAPGPPATQDELTEELIHKARVAGPTMRKAMWILAGLAALGIIAAVIMMLGGIDDHTQWSYYAVAYFYVFSLVMGIPIASIGLRFARAQWRRPTSRAAELFALAGPVMLLFFLPIMAAHPGLEGRRSLWMDWQLGPWLPDLLMLTALVGIGLIFVYTSALPDLAAVRDHGSGRSRGIAGVAGIRLDRHSSAVGDAQVRARHPGRDVYLRIRHDAHGIGNRLCDGAGAGLEGSNLPRIPRRHRPADGSWPLYRRAIRSAQMGRLWALL